MSLQRHRVWAPSMCSRNSGTEWPSGAIGRWICRMPLIKDGEVGTHELLVTTQVSNGPSGLLRNPAVLLIIGLINHPRGRRDDLVCGAVKQQDAPHGCPRGYLTVSSG